jgi:S1-C subfamily serine protease
LWTETPDGGGFNPRASISPDKPVGYVLPNRVNLTETRNRRAGARPAEAPSRSGNGVGFKLTDHPPFGLVEWLMRPTWLPPEAVVMTSSNALTDLSRELSHAVEIGEQAVVAVHGRPHIPSSGILWDAGVVVTSDHTLKRDEEITVTLPDGRGLPATLAGRDGGTDLAVLRIETRSDTSAAKTADEASLKAGNLVLALGRRGENGVSASLGVISAIGGAWRTWRGGQIERFIRPDLNIYPGFSGGALVDVEGRVIGLNTSGLTRGAGVTIPASTVSRVIGDLLTRGHVRRGYLGVGLHPVQLPDGRAGLIILSIEPNGPAAQAGVFLGDVLLTLAGKPVRDTDDVQEHLGADRVGKPVTAELVRGGAALKLDLVPGERRPEGAR